MRIGDFAGVKPQKDGYCYIGIDGKSYQAHKLAILYITGKWCDEVDHENMCRSDNRFSNLRPSTRAENSWNKKKYSNNKSGFKGVSKHNQMNKWRASIGFNGKVIHLGLFDDKIEAAIAYDLKAIELFGNFANLNFKKE